ncbi:NCS1 family nucleobase:cation symporter-1 [Yunchengibacter salinarum]|uniref:NCS1 family nucleobase:cation symporter-1 n=1 Tax=Yunchengibacter salinarum TaxID=3133399 RepID=UPI0035B64CDA
MSETQSTAAPATGTTQSRQRPEGLDADLWNPDLAPVDASEKTWDWRAYAALWVAMVACVPTYLLAAGLVGAGMAWWQAVITVFLGNVIVLIPMVLVGHGGAKHGLPFPVLLRSAFGTTGAKIPAVARGLVACGWFGINTWLGGSAIYQILNKLTDGAFIGAPLPVIDIDTAQTLSFLGFWAMHIYFIRNGTDSIRWLETLAAPFLLLMGVALLGWAYVKAGGFGEMLSAPSQFVPGGEKEGLFWPTFFVGLTGMVGFWATMSLNIPDFTRFARDQKSQIIGQAVGLPIPMALYTFIAVAVTSATVTIYGERIWNPVELAARMEGVTVIIALVALVIASLTTNLAANVVAPAYGFSNLAPEKISFRTGGYITAFIGIAIFPWKLMESAGAYITTWLVGYSALLGPIAGILIADYFLARKTDLDVPDLFRHSGRYGSGGGWHAPGIIALVVAVLPNLPGFLAQVQLLGDVPDAFDAIYRYAWFVGFFLAIAIYMLLWHRDRLKHA